MTSGEGVDDLERETCLRCGGRMSLLYRKFLQTGTPGWHLRGDLECFDSSLLPVEVWCCQECHRLEFYLAEDAAPGEGSGIAKARCPHCGMLHELDDARCPHCGKRLY